MSDTETNDPAPITPLVPPVAALPPPPRVEPAAPVPAPRPRRSAWPVFFVLGFVVLAAGEGYLFVQQRAHQADAVQLAVLRAQFADMQAAAQKAGPAPDSVLVQAQIAQKLAMLEGQVNAMQGQQAADHGALAQLQASAADLTRLTGRMTTLNALSAATLALQAGQPLGAIPNAPPALQAFATAAPPTMAQLRENFAPAANAAEAASLSDGGQTGWWARTKLRLEGLFTITNGDHVVFGPPAAGVLAQARAALDADDLAGAVAAANRLSPPAQAAMAGWLTPARQLLAARQALAGLAAQGG